MGSEMTPENIDGKLFQQLIIHRYRKVNESGKWHADQYGVRSSAMRGPTGDLVWQPYKSLPDFEAAVAPYGRQVIFDAKVCSQASFPIGGEATRKKKQFQHLVERSRVGALCYLLIHFNKRVLKTRVDEAFTVLLPVKGNEDIFLPAMDGATMNLNRSEAMLRGELVPWNAYGRGRKVTPDLTLMLEHAVLQHVEPAF